MRVGNWLIGQGCLGCDIGGAKELGVMYFPTNWGAKEPQNLPNHRVVVSLVCFFWVPTAGLKNPPGKISVILTACQVSCFRLQDAPWKFEKTPENLTLKQLFVQP